MPRLEFAILCEAATVRDGLAYIIGANTRNIKTPALPIDWMGAVVLNISFDDEEIGRIFNLLLTITRDDTEGLLVSISSPVPAQRLEGSSPLLRAGTLIQFAFGGMRFTKYGMYRVRISLNDNELAVLPLLVQEQPQLAVPRAADEIVLPQPAE